MKIRNYEGRSWLTQYDKSGLIIHIVNAEIMEAELKGNNLIIKIGDMKK